MACSISGNSEIDGSENYLQYINNVYLWTRQSQVVAEELSIQPDTVLYTTSFSPYRPTFLITHGFLSSALYNWVITLKDALLSHADCNVLAVSWESGSSRLSYYVVESRVPAVGREVALVLLHLKYNFGLNLASVHLVGHSLGAHISGFAGKYLNGSIGRITGLDPAGMGFNNVSPKERLDRTDAQFVDVIHTQTCTTLIQTYTCFGISGPVGDVDVWVNGGEEQPACTIGGDTHTILEDGSPCSHSMSYVYYTESIGYPPSSSRYLARHCHLDHRHLNNSCSCASYPQYLGIHADYRSEGSFCVNTSNKWPYALLEPLCPTASFTALQALGLTVVALLIICTTLVGSILLWLRCHPEDQEFFTTEFLTASLAVLIQVLLEQWQRLLEDKRFAWIKAYTANQNIHRRWDKLEVSDICTEVGSSDDSRHDGNDIPQFFTKVIGINDSLSSHTEGDESSRERTGVSAGHNSDRKAKESSAEIIDVSDSHNTCDDEKDTNSITEIGVGYSCKHNSEDNENQTCENDGNICVAT